MFSLSICLQTILRYVEWSEAFDTIEDEHVFHLPKENVKKRTEAEMEFNNCYTFSNNDEVGIIAIIFSVTIIMMCSMKINLQHSLKYVVIIKSCAEQITIQVTLQYFIYSMQT